MNERLIEPMGMRRQLGRTRQQLRGWQFALYLYVILVTLYSLLCNLTINATPTLVPSKIIKIWKILKTSRIIQFSRESNNNAKSYQYC